MLLRCLSLFSVLLLALAGCAKRSASELRVGMELSYPPFETTDEQGQPAGVSVDLANALGEALHRKVIIENIAFTGLLPALKTGKIDLVISSLTATPQRAETVDFSEPYGQIGLALLVGKDSPVKSIEDLRTGSTVVAVKQGSTGYYYATTQLPQAKLRVLEDESACILEVSQGKAAAFLYDQLSVWKAARQYASSTRALLAPVQKEAWAIALRKGDDALRGPINQFLQQYRVGGGFDRLGDRWLSEQKAAFKALGVTFIF